MPFRLYALVTWTTERRLPLIQTATAAFLRRMLPAIASRHGAKVIEIGIVRNHVHMVVELPSANRYPPPPSRSQRRKRARREPRPDPAACEVALGRWIRLALAGRPGSQAGDSLRAHPINEASRACFGGVGHCFETPRAESPGSAPRAPCKGAPPAERALSGRGIRLRKRVGCYALGAGSSTRSAFSSIDVSLGIGFPGLRARARRQCAL